MRISNELNTKEIILKICEDRIRNDDNRIKWIANKLYKLIKNEYTKEFDKKNLLAQLTNGYDKQDLENGTVGHIADRNWRITASHVVDWLGTDTDTNPHDLRGVQTLDGLNKLADQYFNLQNKLACMDDLEERKIVDKMGAYTWVKITTEKGLKAEGKAMKHCVGSYWNRVKKDECEIYSLRDEENWPHATLQIREGQIVQQQGRSGAIAEKYQDLIKKFKEKNNWEEVQYYSPVPRDPPDKMATINGEKLKAGVWKSYKDGCYWVYENNPTETQTYTLKRNSAEDYAIVPSFGDSSFRAYHSLMNEKNETVLMVGKHKMSFGDGDERQITIVTGASHYCYHTGDHKTIKGRYNGCKDTPEKENYVKECEEILDYSDKLLDLMNGYKGFSKEIRYSYRNGPVYRMLPTIYKLEDEFKLVEKKGEGSKASKETKIETMVVSWNKKQKLWNDSYRKKAFVMPTELLECESITIKCPANQTVEFAKEITAKNQIKIKNAKKNTKVGLKGVMITLEDCDCTDIELLEYDKEDNVVLFKNCTNIKIPPIDIFIVQLYNCTNVKIDPKANIHNHLVTKSEKPIELKKTGPYNTLRLSY